MGSIRYLVLAAFLAISVSAIPAAPRGPGARGGPRAAGGGGRINPLIHRDVEYGHEDPAQKIDVYTVRGDSPTPVVIFIHGGGWKEGTKSHMPPVLPREIHPLGIALVGVEYRLSGVASHPAQVNDALRAVQFVRSQAKEWNIDTKRMAVMGSSAGAHLALYVGLHDDVAKPGSSDPVERESSRVACVVDYFGPSDFFLLRSVPHAPNSISAMLTMMGVDIKTPPAQIPDSLLRDVSPASFVSHDDPPVLILHGTEDHVVPLAHSQKLDSKLREARVDSTLLVLQGEKHGFRANPEADAATVKFLKAHLMGEEGGGGD